MAQRRISLSTTPEKTPKPPPDEKLYVLIGAHNHEKFIGRALNGALRQRVDIPFQIIAWDDASTDKTARIISRFARRFPETMIPVLNETNQHSVGKVWMWELLSMAKRMSEGTPPEKVYLAFCEGDDFWTDHHKLQKQLDFLRNHPTVSFVHHRVKVLRQGVDKDYAEGVARHLRSNAQLPEIVNGDYLLTKNLVATNSVFMRLSSVISSEPIRGPAGVFADWLTWFLASRWGPIGYINEKLSAYRLHTGGMYSGGASQSNKDKHEITLQYLKSLSA